MFATVLVSYVYQVHSAVRRLSIASIQRLDREQHQPGWGTPKGGARGGGCSIVPGVKGGVFITTLSGSRDKEATSATHDPGIAEAYDSGRRTLHTVLTVSPGTQRHTRPPSSSTDTPAGGRAEVGGAWPARREPARLRCGTVLSILLGRRTTRTTHTPLQTDPAQRVHTYQPRWHRARQVDPSGMSTLVDTAHWQHGRVLVRGG